MLSTGLLFSTLSDRGSVLAQAGDAVFIPEGWWHQVDSQDTTIAVNFWWHSAFAQSLQPHMHQYYLRRIVDGLLDWQRSKALAAVLPHPQLQALQNTAEGQSEQGSLKAASSSADSTSASSSEDGSPASALSEDERLSPEMPSAAAEAAGPARTLHTQTDTARAVVEGSQSAAQAQAAVAAAAAPPPLAAPVAAAAAAAAPSTAPVAAVPLGAPTAEATGLGALPCQSSATAAAAMMAMAAAAASAAAISITALDVPPPPSLHQQHSHDNQQDAELQSQAFSACTSQLVDAETERQGADHNDGSLRSQRQHKKRKACDMSGESAWPSRLYSSSRPR